MFWEEHLAEKHALSRLGRNARNKKKNLMFDFLQIVYLDMDEKSWKILNALGRLNISAEFLSKVKLENSTNQFVSSRIYPECFTVISVVNFDEIVMKLILIK